jgi:hypothetical protein
MTAMPPRDGWTSAGELRRSLVELGPREVPVRARLLHRLAWELRDQDAAVAHDLATEALDLARRLDDAEAEAGALVARAYAAAHLAHAAAPADAVAAVRACRRLADPVGLRRALHALELCRAGRAAPAGEPPAPRP